MSGAAVVLERLHEHPGGEELARLARRHRDVALVGGAVRDLLLGRTPKELDVVVSTEASRFAGELLGMLELRQEGTPVLTLHDRFGTAAVVWPAGRVDVAERRAESYPQPGALPEVEPGSEEEDLARRDFTVLSGGIDSRATEELESLLLSTARVGFDDGGNFEVFFDGDRLHRSMISSRLSWRKLLRARRRHR